MTDIINKKIDELSLELQKQTMTTEDMEEIEKDVADYKQQLIEEKEEEYASNKIIIEAQIEVLKQVKKEEESTMVSDSTI